jgi:hypothetical protein
LRYTYRDTYRDTHSYPDGYTHRDTHRDTHNCSDSYPDGGDTPGFTILHRVGAHGELGSNRSAVHESW